MIGFSRVCAFLLAFALLCPGCREKSGSPAGEAEPRRSVQEASVPDSWAGRTGLAYEETPAPVFTDYINQVDYALAQTMQRMGISIAGLRVISSEVKEYGGRIFQVRRILIAGVRELPVFVQALRDALVAWADRAALLREEGGAGVWHIVLDGVITHYLWFSTEMPPEADAPARARLVIVMDDLGESLQMVSRLLALDFPVSCAIWPHSSHAGAVDALAHARGREILVHQPMEPLGYPEISPGLGALMLGMDRARMRALLEESFFLVPHASGLNNHMGSLLTQDAGAMRLVAQVAREKGLFILDSLTHARSRLAGAALDLGARALKRDIFLDVDPRKESILAQLRQAERIAAVRGQAVAIGHPLPSTVEALEAWQTLRNREILLVRLEDLTPLQAARNDSTRAD